MTEDFSGPDFSADLHAVSAAALADEAECVEALLEEAKPLAAKSAAIGCRAAGLVDAVRSGEHGGKGVESFLRLYGLDTHEGVALMCLAEALLRVPDAATADALIHDKFHGTRWKQYLGKSGDPALNASTWGLLLTGAVVSLGEGTGLAAAFGGALVRLGEPVIRRALKHAMYALGSQFVAGETIADARKNTAELAKNGYLFSFDMLGEGARTQAQAGHYFRLYLDVVTDIAHRAKEKELFDRPGISIKLSALHPRYEWLQRERVMRELLPRLREIALRAMRHDITIAIDAEEASRLDLSLELYLALCRDPVFSGYDGLGFVVQAYQKRAPMVIDFLAGIAAQHKRRIPLRLVKGAYWDSEIKRAQQLGLASYQVFTRKCYTDLSYLACAARMLRHGAAFYPQFATHNARTVSSILEMTGKAAPAFEFQKLFGMGNALYAQLVRDHRVRIYAPVGRHIELLPYLIRRLLENGANSSFIHHMADPSVPVAELLEDPMAASARLVRVKPAIPLPEALYGKERRNSRGFDPGYRTDMDALLASITDTSNHEYRAAPVIAGKIMKGKALPVISPANLNRPAGEVIQASPAQAAEAIQAAHAAFPAWRDTPVAARARMLEKAADHIEADRAALIHLLQREAGKTLMDTLGEVREAADFCRYYALEARRVFAPQQLPGVTGEQNTLHLEGRGAFACISPWNFPLAIFTGQIAAALAAGNTVLAKPAEQTPLAAMRAVRHLHAAGIPGSVLHLLPGTGESVGKRLVEDPRVAGVAFTGSTDTARAINLVLATRPGPLAALIAETGGQNAMIVDSTALPEQAADDIIVSAFNSAGQRCSALRVLYVQEEIADALLALLSGALAELRVGDPEDPASDTGPVIDQAAWRSLTSHIAAMKRDAVLIAKADAPAKGKGYFLPPHIFEIKSLAQLKREVFGPILHVIRYRAEELDKVIAEINSTGYGLTFGAHSRVAEKTEFLQRSIRAGNIYINRNMIGAAVGAQPFGGMGLSGTGPKAGGPHYLPRFANERTVTVNTAAIGGNLELLM